MDGIEALEVMNKKGEWISAPAIPGTFVIKSVSRLSLAHALLQ